MSKNKSIFNILDNVKNIIKSLNQEQWIVIGEWGMLLLMALLHSLEAGHYVDFIAINGTFQDFNPIRRFMNGQVPYRDFQDYLGMGHLYLGTIFTKIFGGDFRASLIAFRFISFVVTALILYVISRIVLKKQSIALALTNVLLVIFLIEPTFLEAFVGDLNVKDALEYAMTTGNSARMLRGGILPISAWAMLVFWEKVLLQKRSKILIRVEQDILVSVFMGILAGCCFLWSNDYGISCWICILIMNFWFVLSKNRSFWKSIKFTFFTVLISSITTLLVVEVLTFGHLKEWLISTLGTGGYQAWYYNSDKSFYVFDVDFHYAILMQAFLALYYLFRVWTAKGSETSMIRFGILAFANMTGFCAANEYKLLSGGYLREVAFIVLYMTIVSEVLCYIGSTSLKYKARMILTVSSTVLSVSWILSAIHGEFSFQVLKEKGGVYVEELGGNLTHLGEALLETKEFLEDKTVFATYASAQEVISENFQPSGTDYIIHVLGDEKRKDYIDVFETEEFDYTATINEEYSDWEYWIQRANWFFYEKLFANWHPVFVNEYEVYWEKNKAVATDNIFNGDIEIETDVINSQSQKIILRTDETINGMASVVIDYSVKKHNGKSAKLCFNTMLYEENTGSSVCDGEDFFESSYLRSEGKEAIPVAIVDGYGEITLTSKPEKSTYLELYSVECETIYLVQYQYVQIDEVLENENSFWLHVKRTNRDYKILDKAQQIEIDGKIYKIQEFIRGDYIIINKIKDLNISQDSLKNCNMYKIK